MSCTPGQIYRCKAYDRWSASILFYQTLHHQSFVISHKESSGREKLMFSSFPSCTFFVIVMYCFQSQYPPPPYLTVDRFQSERLQVRSRRLAAFTPSAHVRRQCLPVWPPTLNKIPLPLPLPHNQHDHQVRLLHAHIEDRNRE